MGNPPPCGPFQASAGWGRPKWQLEPDVTPRRRKRCAKGGAKVAGGEKCGECREDGKRGGGNAAEASCQIGRAYGGELSPGGVGLSSRARLGFFLGGLQGAAEAAFAFDDSAGGGG